MRTAFLPTFNSHSVAWLAAISLGVFSFANSGLAAEPNDSVAADLDQRFKQSVLPVLETQCLDCHGADDPQGGLDLTRFTSASDVVDHFRVWETLRRRVADGEMPPEESGDSLDRHAKRSLTHWIDDVLIDFANRNAGDPGAVLARRLSAAEYNYTIRDLTGVDIQPAKTFPVDPTNESGFANSGESLMMTPALFEKYIAAARRVAEHLVLGPTGLNFASHPVITDTDRDRYCVNRIVDFYDQVNTNIADYLAASLELPDSPSADAIKSLADRRGLSAKYLTRVRRWIESLDESIRPLQPIHQALQSCVKDDSIDLKQVDAVAETIRELRSKLDFEFPHLNVREINRGSQPFVLWRNRQKASHRMKLNREALQDLVNDEVDTDAMIPAMQRFCEVFPNHFYVDRRGREYIDRGKPEDFKRESEYRLLSAGFHSMMGYFRDDQPLVELMLTDSQAAELDALWFDLQFVADVPSRQHSGFIWFERAEGRFLVDPQFDPYQAADKDIDGEEKITGLRDAYVAKAKRLGADGVALSAIRDHFRRINQSIRKVETARTEAVPHQLDALNRIAELAFRRPLTETEADENREFFLHLIRDRNLSHEQAVRDVLVSILVSPHFCFRVMPSPINTSTGDATSAPLDPHALASRLSYFLWSSMPDDELRTLANDGRLLDATVLQQQTSRMLRDPKSRGLAVEFGGHWLGFHAFLKHQGVDRSRFPQFDDHLRSSMFEEPIRLFSDVIRNDRKVVDLIFGDDTFVNGAVLAKHYGMSFPEQADDDTWIQIPDAGRYGRGGLLPMAVFLTQHSPGLRTSPVKRGYWVVKDLLGTTIPAPPPGVPELPEDESKLGDQTLRELLAQHRADPSCASCHDKFDSFGLAFEAYDPIGRRREVDLGGKPVETIAGFPDGVDRTGVEGLRAYLRSGRDQAFINTFCERLLAFGLGRSLILSDRPLIESMVQDVRSGNGSMHDLVWRVVQSPQFRNQQVQP